jgi:hypothetical protein
MSTSGVYVTNETNETITVILSVVAPTHWSRINPGETFYFQTLKVWFTVTAKVSTPNDLPYTSSGQAAAAVLGSVSVAASATASVVLGVAAAASRNLVLGAWSAHAGGDAAEKSRNMILRSQSESSQKVSKMGVYADGRTLTVSVNLINGLPEMSIVDLSQLRDAPTKSTQSRAPPVHDFLKSARLDGSPPSYSAEEDNIVYLVPN